MTMASKGGDGEPGSRRYRDDRIEGGGCYQRRIPNQDYRPGFSIAFKIPRVWAPFKAIRSIFVSFSSLESRLVIIIFIECQSKILITHLDVQISFELWTRLVGFRFCSRPISSRVLGCSPAKSANLFCQIVFNSHICFGGGVV